MRLWRTPLTMSFAAPPNPFVALCGHSLVRALVFVCTWLAVGCQEAPRASLLDLHDVEAEDAASFVVHGRGFPTDRQARVELRGVVHRPGEGASPVTVTLAGAASSDTALVFSSDGSSELAALSPGQFEGRLRVTFAAGAAEIRGELDGVHLPLRSARADGRRDALHAARRGSEWLASLGASELELDLDRTGVRVGLVEPAGVAELAGLAPGDRIIALDGTAVGDLADLWPAPAPEPVRLTVERGAASRQVQVSLPRAAGRRLRAEPRGEWVGALTLAFLGALLLVPARGAAGRGADLCLPPLGGVLVGCCLAVVGIAVQVGANEQHVLRGVLPVVAAFALTPLLGPRSRRLEASARVAVQLAVAFVAVATAGLLCGTLSPSLDATQGGGDWPLLLQPPGWGLLAMAHLALRSTDRGAAAQGIAVGARGVVTGALVALLGGAGVFPGLDGVAGLAAVTLLTWLALEWVVARRELGSHVLGAVAVGGLVVALAWFLGAPSQAVAATVSALSPWLLGGLCLRAFVVRVRARWWPAPRFDPQLAPFL